MKAILRQCKTDADMLEIVTVGKQSGRDILWAVVHSDFIFAEDIKPELDNNNEIKIEIINERTKHD